MDRTPYDDMDDDDKANANALLGMIEGDASLDPDWRYGDDDDNSCPECERSNGPHYTGPCEH